MPRVEAACAAPLADARARASILASGMREKWHGQPQVMLLHWRPASCPARTVCPGSPLAGPGPEEGQRGVWVQHVRKPSRSGLHSENQNASHSILLPGQLVHFTLVLPRILDQVSKGSILGMGASARIQGQLPAQSPNCRGGRGAGGITAHCSHGPP